MARTLVIIVWSLLTLLLGGTVVLRIPDLVDLLQGEHPLNKFYIAGYVFCVIGFLAAAFVLRCLFLYT
jgi:hypothetical protein